MEESVQFKGLAELSAHYAAARARLWGNVPGKAELSPVAPPPPPPPPSPPVEPGPLTTLAKIRLIAKQHGFVFEQLRENFGRTKAEVTARREIMVFLRSLGWGQCRIAGFLHLDQTSVEYGLRKADKDGGAERFKGRNSVQGTSPMRQNDGEVP